jgi:seryl-tRNA synthetase
MTSKSTELEEVQSKCNQLQYELRNFAKREEKIANQHFAQMRSLEKKITEAEQHRDPLCEGDVPMAKESLAALDKLSFPMDGMWKGKGR